jgi:phosphoribosylformylglycinamidine cyclo-ligase
VVQRRTFETPRIFTEIQHIGEIPDEEMASTFNLGLGMIVVVPPSDAYKAQDLLRAAGHRAVQVGEIVEGEQQVHLA